MGGAAPTQDEASEGEGQHYEHNTRLDRSVPWTDVRVRDSAGTVGPCEVVHMGGGFGKGTRVGMMQEVALKQG